MGHRRQQWSDLPAAEGGRSLRHRRLQVRGRHTVLGRELGNSKCHRKGLCPGKANWVGQSRGHPGYGASVPGRSRLHASNYRPRLAS